MKWFNFHNIKNSSFHVTPNLPIETTKRYKISIVKLAAYLSLYTLFAWLVLLVIISVTPLKDVLVVINNSELKAQTEKIQQLQDRVISLTEQLQTLASANEKIKYAIKLAQKDSTKSNDAIYDTLRKPIYKKVQIGGSILNVFRDFLTKYFFAGNETIPFMLFSPCEGIITQEFNPSIGHMGIDYGLKIGSPVYAAAGGLVTFADYTFNNGFMIIIQHDDGFVTLYQHCSAILKKVRDYVNQGDLIALSGNSGKNTTGPHLHFEVWENGKPIDPQKIILK
jgi:murein DD-endopeptidase MepM/ murein hydrolase activator NlpD